MTSKRNRDYIIRHEQIWNKLVKMAEESDSGCIRISKIATELGMDTRTVRAHLKILEVHNAGVFIDSDEKEFCTKEGIALLARRLRLTETADEQES